MNDTKPRVVFPFVEAGMGHIAPMRAIADKFKELYGDKVDVVESKFFSEGNNQDMITLEQRMCKSVVDSNKHNILGFMTTNAMNMFGARISNSMSIFGLCKGALKPSIAHMEELKADVVFSTHWSTNYIASKCAKPPISLLYCPDTKLYPIFNYKSDLTFVPTQAGYEEALKKYRRRYNEQNLRRVPMAIREEAYGMTLSKAEARAKFGIDADKFTVILVDGGYGIGKSKDICKEALHRDLPVNLIPICGKNEMLYKEISSWKQGKNCRIYPVGFTDKMLEYLVCADLFCGKSGANTFAEACFFGIPQIVTQYASGVEKLNGRYYVNDAKTAFKIFSPSKVAKKIEQILDDPNILEPLRINAEAQRNNYGTNRIAALIYEAAVSKTSI